MPLSVQLGVLLAVLTALASIVGFLLKHRGALVAPAVEWRRPVASTVALFRSPVYTIGCLIAVGGWGLHVGALSLAPISLVQTVIAGGLVLLTVVADHAFGLPVSRREWIGVAAVALGLAGLAATLGSSADSAHSRFGPATLAAYVGLSSAAAVVLVAAAGRTRVRPGLVLAVSAGLMWGASDCSIKALSGELGPRGALVLVHPLALVILVLSLVGMLVSARSLQLGPPVAVIALTSAAANVMTIAAGPLVFDEPLPARPLTLAVRALAFALVVGAAALTPPPLEPDPAA